MTLPPKVAKCRSCGAVIFWAAMPSGKPCCFDAAPAADGKYVIVAWDVKGVDYPNQMCMGKYRPEEYGDEEPRYHSHFTTCPNASKHSKKAKS